MIINRGIALVDFDVPWSASCRIQEGIINSLARKYRGRASVVSVDVDGMHEIATQFDIRNVPTLILFKEGTEVTRFFGLQSEETLSRAIENELAPN